MPTADFLQRNEHQQSAIVQTQLEIGQPNDQYEQEAGQMADMVMQSNSSIQMMADVDDENSIQMMGNEAEYDMPTMQSETSFNVQTMLDKNVSQCTANNPAIQRACECSGCVSGSNHVQMKPEAELSTSYPSQPVNTSIQSPDVQRASDCCEEDEKVQMSPLKATPMLQRTAEGGDKEEEKIQRTMEGTEEDEKIQRTLEGTEEDEKQIQKKEMNSSAPSIQCQAETPGIQCSCKGCTSDNEKVQKKSQIQRSADGTSHASSELSGRINASKGNGQPLPENVQTELGGKMGADFSNVKVHTDGKSVQMNKELNAKAFTNGQDIYFNEGNYNPTSNDGKHLLAHELTHTIQQSGNNIQKVQRVTENITNTQATNAGTFLRGTYDFRSVKIIQQIVGTDIDGQAGRGTARAVHEYQVDNNWEENGDDNGKVEEDTLEVMMGDLVNEDDNYHDFMIHLLMDYNDWFTDDVIAVYYDANLDTADIEEDYTVTYEAGTMKVIKIGPDAFNSYTELSDALDGAVDTNAPEADEETAETPTLLGNDDRDAAIEFNGLVFRNAENETNTTSIKIIQHIVGMYGDDNDGNVDNQTVQFIAQYQQNNEVDGETDGKIKHNTMTQLVDDLVEDDNRNAAIRIIADFYGVSEISITNMIRSGDETETVSLPDIAPMLASIKIGDDVDAGDLLDTIAEEAGAEADAPAEASGATVNPLWDMSTFQAPALTCNTAGGSGAWGATYGNVRSGCTSSHGGWDIFARIGTPVRAVTDGTVTHQQQAGGGGWGHYLLLDPADENSDLSFRYAHLTNIEIGNVGHSWDVEAGEIIGYTGVTGNACEAAPHLHFEVLDNGAGTDPDDYFDMPTQYRKFDKDLTLQMPDNPCD